MDVDKNQFPKQLLTILKQISTASFVTFDLEMSGITSRPKHGNGSNSQDAGKPTLQQQYQETKEAAEAYQVLQVGITCVEEDREKEMYVARPYNFYLSPLFLHGDRLDIDRKFSFSSSACDFLRRNNFCFGTVFERGVPYLSREEEKYAKEHFAERMDQNKRDDIVISPSESETLNFYRNARKTISAWIKDTSNSKLDFVNVGNPDGPLNGYQRRLVHQLVTNEFPDFRTFARNEKSFMQIEKIDHKKEAEFQRKKLAEFNSMVAKQTGLRWIFEALCGGDLSNVDPRWFCDEKDYEERSETKKSMEAELREVTRALQRKKHVIVGHNLFTDLIFLYKTFVGKLPPLVRDFQKRIHYLFPVVIDTKYVATHEADCMNPREGLKALWEPFKKMHQPFVALDEKHMSYGAAFGKDHEAGFDSWMTADLFIKLSAKIYSMRKDDPILQEFPIKSSEKLVVTGTDPDPDTISDSGSDFEYDEVNNPEDFGGVLLSPPDTDGLSPDSLSMGDSHPAAWHETQLNLHSNGNGHKSPDASSGDTSEIEQWIPAMGSRFWDVYSNKLRVNSVEGGVCHLSLVRED